MAAAGEDAEPAPKKAKVEEEVDAVKLIFVQVKNGCAVPYHPSSAYFVIDLLRMVKTDENLSAALSHLKLYKSKVDRDQNNEAYSTGKLIAEIEGGTSADNPLYVDYLDAVGGAPSSGGVPEKTLDDKFNEWLASSPEKPKDLTRIIENPLYWNLENESDRLTQPLKIQNYQRFVGLSGSGKTRTLYEECVHNAYACIYITMHQARNGGSRAAQKALTKAREHRLSGQRMCCVLVGMLYAHIRMYRDWEGSKLDKLFLMTQNCAEALQHYCNSMPLPENDEQAVKWMTHMTESTEKLARGSPTCVMLDEIQTVTDRHELQQLIRAVDKLVMHAVVTGTGVQKDVLVNATKDRASGAAKVQWRDVNGPKLLDWGEVEKYIRKCSADELLQWLEERPDYKQWFTPCRARVLARSVAACQNVPPNEYESILEELHEEICCPGPQFLLHSNFGEAVIANTSKVTASHKTIARHLAECMLFGEVNGQDHDACLEDIVCLGVGTGAGQLEPLVMDCLKRMENVTKLIPVILSEIVPRLSASSAGFLFEYPVAYAIANTTAKGLSFLHAPLKDAVHKAATMSNGWYAVLPDRFAGPDVVLFQVASKSVKELKVVQSKLVATRLTGDDLTHALDTTNLSKVYLRKNGTEIKTRSAERAAILEWFEKQKNAGMRVERCLVSSAGSSRVCKEVRVASRKSEPGLQFLEKNLWELLPADEFETLGPSV